MTGALADPRAFLARLFDCAVAAADPTSVIARHLPEKPKGRTVVIGAGKGSAQMAAALENVWDGTLSGTVVTRYGYGCDTRAIRVIEAAHPVPDTNSLAASAALFEAIAALGEDDLVIALVSGGGSALLAAPPENLTLDDEIGLQKALLASGAPIADMNTVRKHVSRIKGGRLAAATRARVHTLVVSDVPGDDPTLVSSGPTLPDTRTRADARAIVSGYRLDLPQAVHDHLESPAADAPHPDDSPFARNSHAVIASAALSLEAVARETQAAGIRAVILSDAIEGEARDIAIMHAAMAIEIARRNRPFRPPVLLLSGGETTVTLRNSQGQGGRNSEFALSLARALAGHETITALAADTDGIDGTGTNAGGFADGASARRILAAGADPSALLQNNLSAKALELAGDLFETGPTGTNVNDFRAVLIA